MRNHHIKKLSAAIIFTLLFNQINAQNNAALLRDARSFEQKFDEPSALEKYKLVAAADSSDVFALVKCAELNCSIGERQKDKKMKASFFDSASEYAAKAYRVNKSNADACYAMALVAAKKTETGDDNKEVVEDVKQIKIYADAALAVNPNNSKANYILGKWHFELIRLSWLKRAAIKTFYGGIPDTQIDSAIYFMEKSRAADTYFALDYLDLAKVYQYDHQPGKAIEVLNTLIKLPNRTADDSSIKEEGKQLLASMQ